MYKELKYTLLLAVAIFMPNAFLHAQNLVPNPAFQNSEMTSTIHYPSELMRIAAVPKNWEIVDGFPDFFNDLTSTYMGYSILNTNDGIGGKLGMRMTNSKNQREAVGTTLSQALVKGEKYVISFTIAQCQYSNYSMNMIPFILSKDRVTKYNIIDHTWNNLCILETNKSYVSKDGWKTVRYLYEAKGGEKYLTLVNNSYTFTQHEKSRMNRARFNYTGNHLEGSSYYFFSEVSVKLATTESGCESFNFSPKEDITKDESFESFKTKLQALLNLNLVEMNEPKLKADDLLPEHVIFMIDISGSMTSGFRNLKRSVLSILDGMPEDKLVSLIVFSEHSRVILERSNKANLTNVLNDLRAHGKTNIKAGLTDLDFLIDLSEKTTLEIFTDDKNSVTNFIDVIRPKQFEHLKTTELYLKYESNVTPSIVRNESNDSTSQRIIKHIYESENPNEYFNFKPGKVKKFQYSTECNPPVQSSESIEAAADIEKVTNNVFLIDVSTSMNERHKLVDLKKSLLDYTASLNSSDRVSVVSFSSNTEVLLNAVKVDDPRFNKVTQELKGRGTTKVDDGIAYIYGHYQDVKHQNLSFVLFTDGVFILSKESERLITENKNIHLAIFQFGDSKNKQLIELAKSQKLNYKKIKPKKVKDELTELDEKNPFPKKYSLEQMDIWKHFQDNIMEMTGYNE